jgi:hypothetical protein
MQKINHKAGLTHAYSYKYVPSFRLTFAMVHKHVCSYNKQDKSNPYVWYGIVWAGLRNTKAGQGYNTQKDKTVKIKFLLLRNNYVC